MDRAAFEAGKDAYKKGDFVTATAMLSAAKLTGEVAGEADHLRGNALMKMGMFKDAADAYGDALSDLAYGHVGALATNQGRAYAAAGMNDEAILALKKGLGDESYPTPYKAYMALGNLYEKQKQTRDAGTAYRNAAIDESNPDPSTALMHLGSCFMELGRPADAAEALRTALDFSSPSNSQAEIYARLAEAYVATSRMQEALDAFQHATFDGTYTLTDKQQAAYTAAQNASIAISKKKAVSSTDQLLASAGYGPSIDSDVAADPLSGTGEFMPSPEDTGFFSITEADILNADKKDRVTKRKHKHLARKIFITLAIIIALLFCAGGFAYFKGYGWPTQEDFVVNLFNQKTNGVKLNEYLSSDLSEEQINAIDTIIPSGASDIQITSIARQMASSEVDVSCLVPEGGTHTYKMTLIRNGIGWALSNVELTSGTESNYVDVIANAANNAAGNDSKSSTGDSKDATQDENKDSESAESDNASTEGAQSVTEGEQTPEEAND